MGGGGGGATCDDAKGKISWAHGYLVAARVVYVGISPVDTTGIYLGTVPDAPGCLYRDQWDNLQVTTLPILVIQSEEEQKGKKTSNTQTPQHQNSIAFQNRTPTRQGRTHKAVHVPGELAQAEVAPRTWFAEWPHTPAAHQCDHTSLPVRRAIYRMRSV